MKNSRNNGLLTTVTIINSAVLLAIGASAYGINALDVASQFFAGMNESGNLDILIDKAVDGTILKSYYAPEEGSTVTLVEIESAMSRLGELTTVSYDYSGVTFASDYSQIVGWDVPFTRNMLAVEYYGNIRTGYTVSDIEFVVDDESQIITVTLPEMEVFSHEITAQEVEWEDNILNHISPDAVTDILDEARDDELEAAFDAGLAQEAEDSAESIIADLLSKVCDYEVEFVVAEEELYGPLGGLR